MKGSAAKKSPQSFGWFYGLGCGGVVALMPGVALLAIVLALPMVAMGALRLLSRPALRTMALPATAGAIHPILTLWQRGNGVGAALALLSDPAVPLLCWALAGLGWAAGEGAEMAAKLLAERARTRAVQRLERERGALTQEWEGAETR